jgi:hypothetical protein
MTDVTRPGYLARRAVVNYMVYAYGAFTDEAGDPGTFLVAAMDTARDDIRLHLADRSWLLSSALRATDVDGTPTKAQEPGPAAQQAVINYGFWCGRTNMRSALEEALADVDSYVFNINVHELVAEAMDQITDPGF